MNVSARSSSSWPAFASVDRRRARYAQIQTFVLIRRCSHTTTEMLALGLTAMKRKRLTGSQRLSLEGKLKQNVLRRRDCEGKRLRGDPSLAPRRLNTPLHTLRLLALQEVLQSPHRGELGKDRNLRRICNAIRVQQISRAIPGRWSRRARQRMVLNPDWSGAHGADRLAPSDLRQRS